MPIVNGKYKNPGWVNNQQPPISAQNLNDISDTLEKLDNDGVGGKRTTRFVVGTSTSGWTAADCDYLCDGTNDDVEIQAALNALPATGGEIVILDGTYTLGTEVQCNNKSIRLAGNGAGITVLESAQPSMISMSTSTGTQQIDSITFRGTGNNAMPTIGLFSELIRITGCEFINAGCSCNTTSNGDAIITGNSFRKTIALKNGVHTLEVGGSGAGNIFDNLFASSSVGTSDVFVMISPSGIKSSNFCENVVRAQNGDSVYIKSGSLVGNTFQNCGKVNAEVCDSVTGNTLINSTLLAGAGSSSSDIGTNAAVTGNMLRNCGLALTGTTTVTGNCVLNPPSYGILIGPGNPIDYNYATPLVEGNIIMFESGASIPGIQLRNNGGAAETDHFGALIFGNKIINTTTPVDIQSKWTKCCVINNFFNTGSVTDSGTDNTVRDNGPQLST